MPIKTIDITHKKIEDVCKKHLNVDIIKDLPNKLPILTKEFIMETDDKEPTYICTDKNRGEFKYRDKDSNLQSDPKAIKFTKAFLEVADPYIDELSEDLKPKDEEKIKDINKKIKIYNKSNQRY